MDFQEFVNNKVIREAIIRRNEKPFFRTLSKSGGWEFEAQSKSFEILLVLSFFASKTGVLVVESKFKIFLGSLVLAFHKCKAVSAAQPNVELQQSGFQVAI